MTVTPKFVKGLHAPLSVEKIEEMFAAWCEVSRASVVARRCKVSNGTALKYINRGDPSRSIEPFVTRGRRITRQVQRRTERAIIYSTTEQLKETAYQISLLDDAIALAADRLKTTIKRADIRLTDLAKAIQIRNQVMALYATHAVEETTETTISDPLGDVMRRLSPEQIAALADEVDELSANTTSGGEQGEGLDISGALAEGAPSPSPGLPPSDPPPPLPSLPLPLPGPELASPRPELPRPGRPELEQVLEEQAAGGDLELDEVDP